MGWHLRATRSLPSRRNRAAPLQGLPARFFCDSIRFVNLDPDHHSTTLATPYGRTRLAPTAIALPTQARLVQDDPDRVGADARQAIRGAPQSALQRGQRPRGGAIARAVRLA